MACNFLLIIIVLINSVSVNSICNTSFSDDGRVDFKSSLYNCARSSIDMELIYSYSSSKIFLESVDLFSQVNLIISFFPRLIMFSLQICINNLISINELDGTATVDMYFRLRWADPRWVFTDDMWSNVNPRMTSGGVDITQFVTSTLVPLPLWLPDIYFEDAVDFKSPSQSIKFSQNGSFYWYFTVL